MGKTTPSLFADSASDSPIIYDLNTVSRAYSKPEVTFRFNKGQLGLSVALIKLLEIEDSQRVSFVNYKGSVYVTRVARDGHWVEMRRRDKGGIVSGQINAKVMVQDAVRSLGHGPDEVICLPVAPHKVSAGDVGLDPAVYPYPFYRIVKDQKKAKV